MKNTQTNENTKTQGNDHRSWKLWKNKKGPKSTKSFFQSTTFFPSNVFTGQ